MKIPKSLIGPHRPKTTDMFPSGEVIQACGECALKAKFSASIDIKKDDITGIQLTIEYKIRFVQHVGFA